MQSTKPFSVRKNPARYVIVVMPWPSLAALHWERSSCITALTGVLCTATVHSLSSLLSFSFCFIISSLVVLSLSLCPHLVQVAFFCHLFYVSLFFSVSGSTLLCLGYVQLWSLLVLFSHSFRRLPHFYLYFCVYVPTPFFVPCFLLLFLFFCVCVCVLFLFHSPREKAPDQHHATGQSSLNIFVQ